MAKIYQIFLSFSRKKQIFVIVWAGHFFLLFALLIHHAVHRSLKPSRPIAIRTVQTAPPIKESAPVPVKKAAAPKPAASTKPSPKKPEKAAPKKPVIAPIAQEIAQVLSELSQVHKTEKPALFVPSNVEIQTPYKESKNSLSYGDYLICYLQESLDLPEYGEVKIELSIDRQGKLLTSKILCSENKKNSEFLKNRLPELAFPCFNDFNIKETALTFTVSFRNAEIR